MATDWNDFHLIDNYQFDIVGSVFENVATGRYWALASDVDASKLPQAGEACPASLTGTWYVDRCQAVALDPLTYEVTVYFRNYLYLPINVSRAAAADLTSDTRVAYDMSTMFIMPDILGLRRARSGDKSYFPIDGMMEWQPSAVHSAAGAWGAAGTPYDYDYWVVNSYVPHACPFTHRPHYKFLCKDMTITLAVCQFYVAKASFSSTNFKGINTTSSIPSGFGVDDRTTAGKWRGMRQTSDLIKDRDGNEYYKVRRWLAHVPYGGDFDGDALYWDGDKCGGDFTW